MKGINFGQNLDQVSIEDFMCQERVSRFFVLSLFFVVKFSEKTYITVFVRVYIKLSQRKP